MAAEACYKAVLSPRRRTQLGIIILMSMYIKLDVIPKFIRSILHSVACNEVSWAVNNCIICIIGALISLVETWWDQTDSCTSRTTF